MIDRRLGYALYRWLRNLYWTNDAFQSSTNFEHIKVHYYWSQTKVHVLFLDGPVAHPYTGQPDAHRPCGPDDQHRAVVDIDLG